jgi:hypothetical protein
MASGSNDGKTGAPAPDDMKTDGEAGAGTAAAPAPSGDSPKPHGDKMANAVREAADAPPENEN